MSRGSRILLLVAILVGVVAFNARTRAAAPDAPGCAGLAAYRDSMVEIQQDYLAAVAGRDLFDSYALTAADFRLIAEQTDREMAALKAVTPPPFARDWHETYLARVELRHQMALAAAQRGIYAMSLFKGADDYAVKEIAVALKSAVDACVDFAAFAHEFDALHASVNSTPIATPAS